jgi:hypothetical protein
MSPNSSALRTCFIFITRGNKALLCEIASQNSAKKILSLVTRLQFQPLQSANCFVPNDFPMWNSNRCRPIGDVIRAETDGGINIVNVITSFAKDTLPSEEWLTAWRHI